MNSPVEIKELAWLRLEEAKILANNEKYGGAFYLAGYSVELIFKAKVCENLGVPNLFNTEDINTNQINSISELRKILKTHNLFFLLLMSGLKNKFDIEKTTDKNLFKINSLLFANWDESARYKLGGHIQAEEVKNILSLLDNENGFLKWIEQS